MNYCFFLKKRLTYNFSSQSTQTTAKRYKHKTLQQSKQKIGQKIKNKRTTIIKTKKKKEKKEQTYRKKPGKRKKLPSQLKFYWSFN